MKLLYLVHGYPPFEKAGTEQHCRQLAEGFANSGHRVLVISATRSIGHLHGEQLVSHPVPGLTLMRIVNNIPSRPLQQAERDLGIEHLIERAAADFSPDIVHIQHLQFLSTGLHFNCPTLISLHDSWLWCAAGGTELRQDLSSPEPCDGPTPSKCAHCVPRWNPQPTETATRLMRIADRLSPWVAPATMHSIWKKIPLRIRSSVARPVHSTEPMPGLLERNAAFKKLANNAVLISPSQYLADRAVHNLLPTAQVIRHGANVPNGLRHIGGGGFLFVGTIREHKGPQLVAQAHQLAFNKGPALRFIGQGDPSLVSPFSVTGPLPHSEVLEQIARADFLVMGSIWPENAPLVISEARAIGTPIIAPNIGGIPELVQDGVDGFLYPPGDAEALAQCMRQAIDSSTQISPRPVKTLADMIEQYSLLYQKLAS